MLQLLSQTLCRSTPTKAYELCLPLIPFNPNSKEQSGEVTVPGCTLWFTGITHWAGCHMWEGAFSTLCVFNPESMGLVDSHDLYLPLGLVPLFPPGPLLITYSDDLS